MKNSLVVFLLLLAVSLQAQHTISGTFSPAKDYTWLIAYHLKPGTQVYIADTAIKDGKFELKIPQNAPSGTYRLVYAVPQEEFSFDIIYNGKEDLELAFDSAQGLTFTGSDENILFSTYFKEIQDAERRLIAFYSKGSSDENEFKAITQNYMAMQHSYLERSLNLMAHEFIMANRPYIPPKYETINEYVKNRKDHYFDAMDITKPALQASGFLTDKLTNYVFTALPLEQMTQVETQRAMQENVKTIYGKLEGVSDTYKFHLLYSIWTQAAASSLNDLSDFVHADYLKSFGTSAQNKKIIDDIEVHNRLRIGAIAPEITWKDGDALQNLSELSGGENYVLVFWSSTCDHCLKELPALHKRLEKNAKVKVVAIGLEDDDTTWKMESGKLAAFEHAIALGKWESDYAHLYAISQTPTYFILDKDKHIIAKPESDTDVVAFLEK